jgi:hypothetical protein
MLENPYYLFIHLLRCIVIADFLPVDFKLASLSMGKKRKSHESNEGDQFKLKIKPNSSECTLVSFPSGYKPGTANEEWQAFEHAECKTRGAIVLATVRASILASMIWMC